MVKLFLETLFLFFAVIGIVSISENIIRTFFFKKDAHDAYVVLTVKNQQESVEATVRSIVWQYLHSKNGGRIPQIVIIDMGSSDDTVNILKKLANDYDFIHITDKQGYIDWIRRGC